MTYKSTSIYSIEALVNFSFYGIKSLLVLYLTQDIAMTSTQAVALSSGVMSASYLITLLGGYVVDRFANLKICLVTSLVCINAGLCLITMNDHNIHLLLMGLAFFVCGNGLFKPLVPLMLENIFQDHPERREKGYTLFYAVLTTSCLLGFVICGFISQHYGKTTAFLAIFICALLAMIVALSRRKVSIKVNISFGRYALYFTTILAMNGLLIFCFEAIHIFLMTIPFLMALTLLFFGVIYFQSPEHERKSILFCYLIALCFCFFASLFEQSSGTAMLFVEQRINREIVLSSFGNILIPTPLIKALDALFFTLFSLYIYFKKSEKRSLSVKAVVLRLGVGYFFVALYFLILMMTSLSYPIGDMAPLFWVIVSSFSLAIGELLIVPLSFTTLLTYTPPRLKGLFISLWTLSIAYGHYFSGLLSKTSGNLLPVLSESVPVESIHFSELFAFCAILSLLFAMIILLILQFMKPIKK